jgi:hypothetical protein
MSGNHAGKPLSEKQELRLAKKDGQSAPKHARVTTEPPEGSDPNPAPEPTRTSGKENDARLKEDVPPHY